MKNGNGDCFYVVGQAAIMGTQLGQVPLKGTNPKDYTIVHAYVTGEGPVSGIRFAHAWIEFKRSIVIDKSNGNNITLPTSIYYNKGKIVDKRGEFARYSFEEATKKMIKTGHYGPWDLNPVLSEDFRDIGKVKRKLTTADKKILTMPRR